MKTVLLEEMSWLEIKQALENGYKTVIITAASIEQHGPHLAENTDSLFGLELSKRVAIRLKNALVAPVIRPGLSKHHLTHPGSLTLRPEIFIGIVEDYIAAYVHHGFETIILFSSHGGNFTPMINLIDKLKPLYPGKKIIFALGMQEYIDTYRSGEKQFALAERTCGGHACDFETSFMLRYYPHLVNMELAVQGCMEESTPAFIEKLFLGGIADVSPTGILGDPRAATAEKGDWYLKAFEDIMYNSIAKQLGL